MIRFIKGRLIGSPFEGLARLIYKKFFSPSTPNAIALAKEKVYLHLLNLYGRKVQYGHFKGMMLNQNIWWGGYDFIPKLLGVYEEHVLNRIKDILSCKCLAFIDIGAADGYFAIGVAYSGMSESVVAFETSDQARRLLAENASRNYCENRIAIRGEADHNNMREVLESVGDSLILIDIEGAEYALLDEAMLKLVCNCWLIVELHPRKILNGFALQEKLLESANKIFDIEIMVRDTYNPNFFEELSEFSDDERLLSFSEGRKANGQWLVMKPK